MQVQWKKARDYFNALTVAYFEVKEDVESGKYGSEHNNMRAFMIKYIGVQEPQFIKIMNMFDQQMAMSDKELLTEAEKKVRQQKLEEEEEARRQREAEKDRKANEREVERARKTAEREAEQVRKADEKRQREAVKEQQEAEKKQRAEQEKREATNERRREQRRQKSEELAKAVQESGTKEDIEKLAGKNMSSEAATLLALYKDKRIELGQLLAQMRELVQTNKAGKDLDGKPWAWNKWCETFINRSRSSIKEDIDAYYNEIERNKHPPSNSHDQAADIKDNILMFGKGA